jgi:hypothetical protein
MKAKMRKKEKSEGNIIKGREVNKKKNNKKKKKNIEALQVNGSVHPRIKRVCNWVLCPSIHPFHHHLYSQKPLTSAQARIEAKKKRDPKTTSCAHTASHNMSSVPGLTASSSEYKGLTQGVGAFFGVDEAHCRPLPPIGSPTPSPSPPLPPPPPPRSKRRAPFGPFISWKPNLNRLVHTSACRHINNLLVFSMIGATSTVGCGAAATACGRLPTPR